MYKDQKKKNGDKEEIILDWRIWNNPMFICFSFFNTRSIDQVFYDNDKMVRKQQVQNTTNFKNSKNIWRINFQKMMIVHSVNS